MSNVFSSNYSGLKGSFCLLFFFPALNINLNSPSWLQSLYLRSSFWFKEDAPWFQKLLWHSGSWESTVTGQLLEMSYFHGNMTVKIFQSKLILKNAQAVIERVTFPYLSFAGECSVMYGFSRCNQILLEVQAVLHSAYEGFLPGQRGHKGMQ